MRKKLIIFDLDGTLVDAYPAIIASFNHAMRTSGYPEKPGKTIRAAVGWGDENLLKPYVGAKDLKSVLAAYRKHHRASLLKRLRWMPHAKELLFCLKSKGLRLAIASNRPTQFTKIILKKLKVRKLFDAVLCADKLRYGKPHPMILNRLVKKFKVSKKETLFVGDMVIDTETGRRAGIETAAVATGSNTLSQLQRARPTYLFKGLRALENQCYNETVEKAINGLDYGDFFPHHKKYIAGSRKAGKA